MRVYWTEEEKSKLRYYYEELGLSLSEIYEKFIEEFPHRTKVSIEVKIGRFKLRHTKEQITNLKSRLNSGEKNGMYGKVGPNLGLTKENSERMKIASEKISSTRKEMSERGELPSTAGENNGMYGKESWSKGKTKYDDVRLMNSGIKISQRVKERWEMFSDDRKNEIIGNLSLAANKAKKDTSIEIIVMDILNKLNISYIKHYRCSRYIFDFYLTDYNFVIECQGDYWHGNPEYFQEFNEIQLNNIERDKRKVEYLLNNEIKSLFLWENYIHKNKNILHEEILNSLKT